jgi:hypothetical protein
LTDSVDLWPVQTPATAPNHSYVQQTLSTLVINTSHKGKHLITIYFKSDLFLKQLFWNYFYF